MSQVEQVVMERAKKRMARSHIRGKISRKQRKRIKERDGNKCVICWRKYELTVHHHHDFTGTIPTRKEYMNYNSPYLNPRDCDLITLCKVCHGKIQTCAKGSPLYRLVTDYLGSFHGEND